MQQREKNDLNMGYLTVWKNAGLSWLEGSRIMLRAL